MLTSFLDSSEPFDNFSVSFGTWHKKSRSTSCVLAFFYQKFYFSWRIYIVGYFVMLSMEISRYQEYNTFSKCFNDSSCSTQFPHLVFRGIRHRKFFTKKQVQPVSRNVATCMQAYSELWTLLFKSELYWHTQLSYLNLLCFNTTLVNFLKQSF